MNPLMNPVGSNAEEKLNCINAVVITHRMTLVLIQCQSFSFALKQLKALNYKDFCS